MSKEVRHEEVVIMVPTYNEEGAIESTIINLQNIFTQISSHTMRILVFDSSSTDRTQDIVRNLQKQFNNIHLLTEPEKSGLGSAYVKAMKFAMHELKATVVFQFDADGSHQPKHIPEMLTLMESGPDVVIGSRYVPGGSIPEAWAYYRKCISKVGNQIARLFLTRKYHDYTTGFRAIKVAALRKVNLDGLLSKNYAHLMNLLWELHKTGAIIAESPH